MHVNILYGVYVGHEFIILFGRNFSLYVDFLISVDNWFIIEKVFNKV